MTVRVEWRLRYSVEEAPDRWAGDVVSYPDKESAEAFVEEHQRAGHKIRANLYRVETIIREWTEWDASCLGVALASDEPAWKEVFDSEL